ncbi:MAG: protein kinase domain-containing protein [Thermoanaerobaculia bacterium]
MNRERWLRLQDLLQGAWSLAPDDRAAYLEERCDDLELRREVGALLAVDDAAEDFFERLASDAGVTSGEASEAVDLSGRRVGSYRLLEPLGRGGMGVVYLAERADGAFEQQVAVKLLAMGLTGPEGHRRFVAERQILAGLEHPAIARLLDGGVTEDETPYFVMERIQGERIDAWCDARRLGLRERIELLCRVCEAVEYAHRRLIVHRDLKPANVLVTEDGDPKLLDFGVARLLTDVEAGLTRSSGAAPLTPAWAAPEQLEGRAITTATDTYALGALAYLLLAGVPPHDLEDRTHGGILRRLQTGPPAPSRRLVSLPEAERSKLAEARRTSAGELRRRLTGDLDAILRRALAPAAEHRYGSAGGLAADLEAHLAGRPVAAHPPSLGYRLGRFVTRHRAAAAAAALVLTVGLAGLAGTLWQAREAVHEAGRAGAALDYVRGLLNVLVPESGNLLVDRGEVLANAAEDARTALAAEPLALADVQDTIASLTARIGRYPEALTLREEVLALRREHQGESHPDTAAALGAWAATRAQMGDPDRSTIVKAYTDAVAQLARYPGEASRQADVRLAYATYLADQDDMAEALRQLDAAAELLPAPGEASARQRLEIARQAGAVLLRMDRLPDAERRLRPAIAEARRRLPERDGLLASLLGELGAVLSREHQLDEAIAALEEAVAIQQALYPEGSESTLNTLSAYANALMVAGYLEDAIEVRPIFYSLLPDSSLRGEPSH